MIDTTNALSDEQILQQAKYQFGRLIFDNVDDSVFLGFARALLSAAPRPVQQPEIKSPSCAREPAEETPKAITQAPVAFPGRRYVVEAIKAAENPTGMRLNDGKERVTLPGGTLRLMLRLIDGRVRDEVATPAEAIAQKGCCAAPLSPAPACKHSWVDARNVYIESGEICEKCFAMRAAMLPDRKE